MIIEESTRQRLSELKRGKTHTAEHIIKIRNNARRPKHKGEIFILTDESGSTFRFENAAAAARYLGVSRQTIYISMRRGWKIQGLQASWVPYEKLRRGA